MTKKELIDKIKHCDDDCKIYIEYQGWGIELDNGDRFNISNVDIEDSNTINLEIE